MSFIDEFETNLAVIPNLLQKKYALMRDLDKSLQEVQRQTEQRCKLEIEDMKQRIKTGNITSDSSLIKFSDDTLDEQKHAIRIADEKVALAIQAYDIVDTHIQQLDQYLKKCDEELRRAAERDNAVATGSPTSTFDNNVKSGRLGDSSKAGRKKTRLGTTTPAAAVTANPVGMDLDLPVDPNEPTYCFCNQVSYGEMVACDNPNCKIEWFHYGCVALKEQPKGKWYCSECAGKRGRKKGK
ncbi:unnamed protein product [Cuscuta epithymum]|uniref:PHD finger protein ING n=1 Tax=Cuscuta epithymum TaxID=186058 RepID=A0AAV0EIL4_9ASTE|nr:unnamed protein product [Cuscuta epithymum]